MNSYATSSVEDLEQFREAIASRIRACAAHCGLKGPQALTDLFLQEATKRGLRLTVTRQAVSTWWHGKVIPGWDVIPVLAAILGTEQEWLLFGSKRGEQMKKERQYLARVSEDELALLTTYREASKTGQRTITRTAKSIAEESPAPEASVHPFRRKEDKLKG